MEFFCLKLQKVSIFASQTASNPHECRPKFLHWQWTQQMKSKLCLCQSAYFFLFFLNQKKKKFFSRFLGGRDPHEVPWVSQKGSQKVGKFWNLKLGIFQNEEKMRTVSFRFLLGKLLLVRPVKPASWSLRELNKLFFNQRKVVWASWSCWKPLGSCENHQKKAKFEKTREFFLYLFLPYGTTMEDLW